MSDSLGTTVDETARRTGISPRTITATVERIRAQLDDIQHDFFHVELRGPTGIWSHTAGSEADLRMFFEGVRCGAALSEAVFYSPEIPLQPNRSFGARTSLPK